MMCSINCPKCEEEMEEVIGFPGYVWCRDCHVTKEVDEMKTDPDKNSNKNNEMKEVTNEICDIIKG